MRVKMSHVYEGVTMEQFIATFFSQQFNDEVERRLEVESRAEVERAEDADTIYRKMETVVPKGVVPDAVLRMLGVRRLKFTEAHWYKHGTSTIKFVTTPNVFPGRASVEGTIKFKELPDGKLERSIEGDVRVRVFGISRIVERVILENVERANRKIAETMEEWLEKAKTKN